jgi:hypothetical protein
VTFEIAAIAVVVVAPAAVVLGWLALVGAVVAALAAPTEPEAG